MSSTQYTVFADNFIISTTHLFITGGVIPNRESEESLVIILNSTLFMQFSYTLKYLVSYLLYKTQCLTKVFGSNRSSRNANVCPSVCLCGTILSMQSIIIFLGQNALREHSEKKNLSSSQELRSACLFFFSLAIWEVGKSSKV